MRAEIGKRLEIKPHPRSLADAEDIHGENQRADGDKRGGQRLQRTTLV